MTVASVRRGRGHSDCNRAIGRVVLSEVSLVVSGVSRGVRLHPEDGVSLVVSGVSRGVRLHPEDGVSLVVSGVSRGVRLHPEDGVVDESGVSSVLSGCRVCNASRFSRRVSRNFRIP